MTSLIQPALTMVRAGFSVIPCTPNKTSSILWKQYQDRLMTEGEVQKYFHGAERLAIVCGAVSGNLEILDFDDPATFTPYLELVEARHPGLSARLPKRQTPSGGFHIVYRCSTPVNGNQKLANNENGEVRIESRGQGGYALAPPSPGYKIIEHGLLDCPTLSTAEREILLSTARLFDHREPKKAMLMLDAAFGDRPGDQFNSAHRVDEILLAHGWKQGKRTTAGVGWTRPGKDHGVSGVLLENGKFYVWSSNAHPLEPERSYDAFGLFACYQHGGDFSAAARALAKGDSETATVAKVATVAVADWPEPIPLIVHQQTDPYPLEALPGTIRNAVAEVVAFVQCPDALGACSALSVISIVGQGLVDVRRASKLYGPTSLNLLAIADSGERKSTVDGFFKKPLEEWETEQSEAAKPAMKRYFAESQAWEAKKNGVLTAIKDASRKGTDTRNLEAKLTALEMEKPIPPKVPRLLFTDATPEALAYQLAHGWPVGGVLSSEAGIVFGGHAMSSESAMRNMSMLNSLWGAELLTIDRRSTSSYTVRGARLTMGLAVQPETVKAFLDSSKGLARGIGWLARFLIAWPESTQGQRMYQEPQENWPQLAKFHRRLGSILDFQLPVNEKEELQPTILDLSTDAKAAWIAFHDEVEEELRPGRDLAEARDVASKAADNAARLAALFHLFENGTGGLIGADHMQAAASIVTWHLYEARRFMGEIALPAELNNAFKLDAWLLEYCRRNMAREVPTRTIQQMGPACVRDKRNLDNALKKLVEAERVQVVNDERRKLVKINPALLGGEHGTT